MCLSPDNDLGKTAVIFKAIKRGGSYSRGQQLAFDSGIICKHNFLDSDGLKNDVNVFACSCPCQFLPYYRKPCE